jgi:alkylated DNA nucleotide flippase Atl1
MNIILQKPAAARKDNSTETQKNAIAQELPPVYRFPINNPDSGESTPAVTPAIDEPRPEGTKDLSAHIINVDNRRTEGIKRIHDDLRILIRPGQVVELRALNVSTSGFSNKHTESGFFDYDHLEQMADAAYRLTHDAEGVYFTINPLHRDLLARRNNRVDVARGGDVAGDINVERRGYLLIDADPKRIAGISSTDEEKAKAKEVILKVRDHLRSRNWPDPILADSGNGFHLLYDIDLPVKDDDLVKTVLIALASRFDTAEVQIDRNVFNPSRICKLYGTLARKGDNLQERPHRWTAILEVPEERRPVPRELMEELARSVAREEKTPERPVAYEFKQQAREAVISSARHYLMKMDGAIAGQAGHNQTFKAANVLIRRFGLSIEEAMLLLQEWNQAKCVPPWSERELRHKLEDAAKGAVPRESLLGRSGNERTIVPNGFTGDFMNSADFDQLDIKQEWLIKKALVASQPAVVGGPKKAVKTSVMIDLAVSLGGAKPFLNKFEVPCKKRVLVLSGESGPGTIRYIARRVCKAKRIDLRQCDVVWGFSLPRLNSDVDLAVLRQAIIEDGIQVVIIDPLYLCLLTGNPNLQASNVYQMGPLLLAVSQVCLDAGATPILVHHTTKMNQVGRLDTFEPLELDNLAFAGIAEFARQWILINRREKYDPESGEHNLWLNVGGSVGHSGLYALNVREGILNDQFGGQEWLVKVDSAKNARAEAAKRKKRETEAKKEARDEEDVTKVLKVLQTTPDGEVATNIGEMAGIGRRATGVLLELLQAGKVAQTNVIRRCGHNDKMSYRAWRLIRDSERLLINNERAELLRNGELIETVLERVIKQNVEPDDEDD